MDVRDKGTEVFVPVGKDSVKVVIPNLIAIANPKDIPGVSDEREEVRRALKNPIGSRRLEEIARGKKRAGIIVNDITRPYPGGLLVEEIATELNKAGLNDEDIFLVVAYGIHRVNTNEELRSMFGSEVIRRFRIVHHHADEEGSLITLGKTSNGLPVQINKEFATAEVKIATGLIAPHHSAGFSSGRKSVVPGISGLQCLKIHHSFPIRPKDPSMGWISGNPFHEYALEAARMVGVDFIVNTVHNVKREMVATVAGDLSEAHKAGVEICRSVWEVNIPCRADVVVVSPGGYPRDIDLHQSQKACSCAELACRPRGQIILCAEAPDGAGKFSKLLKEAKHPQEVVEKYVREGFTAESTAKAYMYARALLKYRLGLACSKIPKDEVERMFMIYYPSLSDGVRDAIEHYGSDAKFLVIPYASDIIPVIDKE
ncbi:MAG: nickel-dependent lactate racemase [Synergistota bacterium]|nr:nickel-dependent lactate racemase [Synergistota bacterium]